MLRRWKSEKKDAFFPSGPPRSASQSHVWYEGGGTLEAERNVLTAFITESLYSLETSPWKAAAAGLVKISIRPYPRRSFSAVKGLELTRISRIADLGGISLPVRPLT